MFISSVCRHHFGIKNTKIISTDIVVSSLKLIFLFLVVWFYLGPVNFAGRKISCWISPIRSHATYFYPSLIIFLSPWFSALSCLWHFCLDLFSCVQHIRHVYRHSSVIWGNHIHDCLSLFSLKQHHWDILFFKYCIFFAYDSYKSSFSWCLPHLYQGWGLK